MNTISPKRRAITAAQRGQIVQRVIVDGWSTAEVAVAFEVEERLVAAWVAAYRRDGMASLRHTPSTNFAGAGAGHWLWRRLRDRLRRIGSRLFPAHPPAAPAPLRFSKDDRRGNGR